MDIRQKIIGLLNKIDSETLLKRIYEFIKYIYISSRHEEKGIQMGSLFIFSLLKYPFSE